MIGVSSEIKAVEAGSDRMPRLSSADLRALTRILARARRQGVDRESQDEPPVRSLIGGDNDPRDLTLLNKAREIFEARQRRARFFDRSIFGEPAWDILLALFIHDRSERMCITQIVLLVGTPMTSVLRWLKFLQSEGLITVRKDWLDARVSIIELGDEGRSRLTAYLEDVTEATSLTDPSQIGSPRRSAGGN